MLLIALCSGSAGAICLLALKNARQVRPHLLAWPPTRELLLLYGTTLLLGALGGCLFALLLPPVEAFFVTLAVFPPGWNAWLVQALAGGALGSVVAREVLPLLQQLSPALPRPLAWWIQWPGRILFPWVSGLAFFLLGALLGVLGTLPSSPFNSLVVSFLGGGLSWLALSQSWMADHA